MSILTSEAIEALWRNHCHAIGPIALQDLAFARAVEAEAIAAARVQTVMDCIRKLNGNTYNLNKAECIDEFRALLGKEAQS